MDGVEAKGPELAVAAVFRKVGHVPELGPEVLAEDDPPASLGRFTTKSGMVYRDLDQDSGPFRFKQLDDGE